MSIMINHRKNFVTKLASLVLGLVISLTAEDLDRDITQAKTVTLDGMTLIIQGQEGRVEQHLGRASLYLHEASATLKSVTFENGTIEYDISAGPEWAFMGSWFRDNGEDVHEQFYMRPRQSGRDDALQYTPLLNGFASWQLYTGPGYSANVQIKHDEWNHVKIAVNANRAEIYFNDMTKPAIVIRELKSGNASGYVGFFTSKQGAHYSNIKVDQSKAPTLSSDLPADLSPSPGTIEEWDISSPFPEGEIFTANNLPKSFAKKLEWTPMAVEDSGIVNIARLHGRGNGNTAFARVIINSSKKQTVRLRFGFSDEVTVFMNGKRLYYGQNIWRSRDFRYLGTIGLFDEVSLDLKRGKNELLLAVTENFGGWGVMAKLPVDGSIRIIR